MGSRIKISTQAYFDNHVDANAKKITNLATPVDNSDAVNKSYVDGILEALNGVVYKGVIDCSANPNYPAANAGHLYKVSVAGKIGGVSGISVAIGDELLCTIDATASGDQATVGANWNIVHSSGTGNVIGAASSTDNAIARFDSTTGKIIQNSLATVDDAGSVNIPTGQAYKINGVALTQDDIGDGATKKQYSSTEKTKLAGIEALADVTDAVNIGTSVHGTAEKTILADADEFPMIDSAAANVLEKTLWSTIKAAIKSFMLSQLVVGEVPGGTLNGTNTNFTLVSAPVAGTQAVYLNGQRLNVGAGNDYTISTNTITFAAAPISTDVILVDYWK